MRKQAEKKQKMQAQQVQRQRAVSIMCKIYVGSIYYEIGEQEKVDKSQLRYPNAMKFCPHE